MSIYNSAISERAHCQVLPILMAVNLCERQVYVWLDAINL